ncbi:MAG: efflux RND transporter permease subunit, partial [Planctomycetota bacterium JB042]
MTGEALLARRKSLVVGALLLAAGGLSAVREMPRRLEPTVDPALAAVEATLPGVSAGELEEVLTIRIEEALLELPAVRGVRGRTRDGAALLTDR